MFDSRRREREKLDNWSEQKGRSGKRRADSVACEEESQQRHHHHQQQPIKLFGQTVLWSVVDLF